MKSSFCLRFCGLAALLPLLFSCHSTPSEIQLALSDLDAVLARQAQIALGGEDRLWHEVHDGGHEWRGLRAMEFARTYLPIEK